MAYTSDYAQALGEQIKSRYRERYDLPDSNLTHTDVYSASARASASTGSVRGVILGSIADALEIAKHPTEDLRNIWAARYGGADRYVAEKDLDDSPFYAAVSIALAARDSLEVLRVVIEGKPNTLYRPKPK